MDNPSVIQKATELIALGELRLARNLLLEEGYVNQLDPSVQKEFFNLFPKSPELVLEEQTTLKELFSPNEESRLRAAKYICRQALSETALKREAWLKDPRTIDALIKATEDESSKVVAEIAFALAEIGWRYFRDLRMYPVLKKLLNYPNRDVQWGAICGVCTFYNCPDRWDVLIPFLLSRTPSKFKHEIAKAVSFSPRHLIPRDRADLREALLTARKKEKIAETQRALTKAICWIGNKQTKPELERMLQTEQDGSTQEALKSAIDRIDKES